MFFKWAKPRMSVGVEIRITLLLSAFKLGSISVEFSDSASGEHPVNATKKRIKYM